MDEIWFWMAKFFAGLFLTIGLITAVLFTAAFLSVVRWLWKYRKLKEKE